MAPLNAFVQKEGGEFPSSTKVCNGTSDLDSSNLAQGHLRDVS